MMSFIRNPLAKTTQEKREREKERDHRRNENRRDAAAYNASSSSTSAIATRMVTESNAPSPITRVAIDTKIVPNSPSADQIEAGVSLEPANQAQPKVFAKLGQAISAGWRKFMRSCGGERSIFGMIGDLFSRAGNKLKGLFTSKFSTAGGGEDPGLDDLDSYKKRVIKPLDKYISWWKFSKFGHHHDERARVVKKQILSSNEADEIKHILTRQEQVQERAQMRRDQIDDSHLEPLQATLWQSPRWNEVATVVNPPKKASGYLTAVEEALNQPPPGIYLP